MTQFVELIFPDGLVRAIANKAYQERFPNDERVYFVAPDDWFDMHLDDEMEFIKLVCDATDLPYKTYEVEVTVDVSSFSMTRRIYAQDETIAKTLAEETDFNQKERDTADNSYETCGVIAERAQEIE